MEFVENCWQERVGGLDIGLKVVGTLAVVEGQPGTGSDKNRSSWQERGQTRLRRIAVQLCEHHMRRAVALVGQISEV